MQNGEGRHRTETTGSHAHVKAYCPVKVDVLIQENHVLRYIETILYHTRSDYSVTYSLGPNVGMRSVEQHEGSPLFIHAICVDCAHHFC
jgi:hypothetical protein